MTPQTTPTQRRFLVGASSLGRQCDLPSRSLVPGQQAPKPCCDPSRQHRKEQRSRVQVGSRRRGLVRRRQARLQILRKQGGEAASDIPDQIGPTELSEHPGQAVADAELDPRRVPLDRPQSILDDALRCRTAPSVAAAAPDRPGMGCRITVDLGRTVKFGGDRTDLDAHLTGNDARACIAGYRRSRKAAADLGHVREEAPHPVERDDRRQSSVRTSPAA